MTRVSHWQLSIRLYAGARAAVGCDSIVIPGNEAHTVGDLRRSIARTYPELVEILPVSRFAVDQEFAKDDTLVSPSSEIALIPPVSGG